MTFLKEHAETIFMVNNQSARWETDDDRLDWYGQVWKSESLPLKFAMGSGFWRAIDRFSIDEGSRTMRSSFVSRIIRR